MDILTQRPSRSLEGRVAIVTGAGASDPNGIGNGRAAAILLAEAGCSVFCVDMQLEWASRTVELIQADGSPRAIAYKADVTKDDECKRIVEVAIGTFGRLDILINNVGAAGAPGTAVNVDMVQWAKGLELNVSSMVLMAKHAIPAILKNDLSIDGYGLRGCIVNMGSVAGLVGGTPHLLYPTTKGAVVQMTRAMAAHHAKDGIRVNCVCPGMLYTPMMYGGSGGMGEEMRATRRARSLLGTEGTGWDAGSAVRFLASDESRWMTGVVLPVDAGATAAIGIDMPFGASVNG